METLWLSAYTKPYKKGPFPAGKEPFFQICTASFLQAALPCVPRDASATLCGRTARTTFSRIWTAAASFPELSMRTSRSRAVAGSGRRRTLQTFLQILALLSSPGQQALPQYGRIRLHQHGKKVRIAPQGFRQVSP